MGASQHDHLQCNEFARKRFLMNKEFWNEKWSRSEISFHEKEPNPLLVTYLDRVPLAHGARIFVPLCGKTLDIHWLLSKEFQIVGIELNESAIRQLFLELGVEPNIIEVDGLKKYSAKSIEIYVGDIFNLKREILDLVDAVYDRAAFVALPIEMRNGYALHVADITDAAPQLLICYEYDQKTMTGPPFSISDSEVERQYHRLYEIELLGRIAVDGGLKGIYEARENVWLLRRRHEVS